MLFNFGTEISVFSKICKWWRWGGGGTLRRRCCVSSFLNCYFSDRIYQNGVRHSFNFHFSLLISKKRSKNGVKTLVWMIATLFGFYWKLINILIKIDKSLSLFCAPLLGDWLESGGVIVNRKAAERTSNKKWQITQIQMKNISSTVDKQLENKW